MFSKSFFHRLSVAVSEEEDYIFTVLSSTFSLCRPKRENNSACDEAQYQPINQN